MFIFKKGEKCPYPLTFPYYVLMSIHIDHLSIDADDSAYLRASEGEVSVIHDETRRNDLLSMVRHIMRDESCNIIPVVHAAVMGPVNQWGHDLCVEVTYSRNGWRAIYAARTGERLTNVQCYMN